MSSFGFAEASNSNPAALPNQPVPMGDAQQKSGKSDPNPVTSTIGSLFDGSALGAVGGSLGAAPPAGG